MRSKLLLLVLVTATVSVLGQVTANVNLSGTITDSAGIPIASATIKLETTGLTATSGADGAFTLKSGVTAIQDANPRAPMAEIREGSLFLSIPEKSAVTITAFGLQGEELATEFRTMEMGSHVMALPEIGPGVGFYRIRSGHKEALVKAFSMEGSVRSAPVALREDAYQHALAKGSATAAALYDVISVTKTGYQKAFLSIANSDSNGIKIKMLKDTSPKFSFFVTSMKVLQELSDTSAGFGGDFRFGETGPGAGLRGADKICATIAEKSMKGSSVKGWRAFLSVTADASGKQVNAIDRIGEGPWYDRTGRVLAPKKADLLFARPQNGDPTIQNDLPNEDGVPNHRPDPTKPEDDNHHMVTGSSATGTLKSATATCKDWTTSVGSTANGKPSCGFAWPRSLGGGGGGQGSNWMSTFDAPGCAAGYEIIQAGGAPPGSVIIGGGGGYGGFYCFALNP